MNPKVAYSFSFGEREEGIIMSDVNVPGSKGKMITKLNDGDEIEVFNNQYDAEKSLAYKKFRHDILGDDADQELKYKQMDKKFLKSELKKWNSSLDEVIMKGNTTGNPLEIHVPQWVSRRRINAAEMSRHQEETEQAELEARRRIAALNVGLDDLDYDKN